MYLLRQLFGCAVGILAIAAFLGLGFLVAIRFGGFAGIAAIVIMAFLVKRYFDFKIKRLEQKSLAEMAQKFEDVRLTINAAYPYTDGGDFFEPESGQKLIAVDAGWRGPSAGIELDDINIVDAGTEDPKSTETAEDWTEVAFLDPESGRLVEHVPYRLPSEFRLFLVFVVPSGMKSFKLQYNDYDITPQAVRIAESAPADPPQATARHFRQYFRLHNEPWDIGPFRESFKEAPKLKHKVKVNGVCRYDGLQFCAPDRGDKAVAIDLTIEGFSKNTRFDEMKIVDPETDKIADYNRTLWNCVFLDPASGQILEPALAPMPATVRMLFIYNVPSRLDSIKLSVLGSIITPEAAAIRSSAPLNAPRPAEADFEKAHAVMDRLFYNAHEEPEPDEAAAAKS
ncbi:MAG: hypothetical protein ABFD69_04555 [Candidatus Sumerlaeia bacterium]